VRLAPAARLALEVRHTTANRIMQEDKPIMRQKLWTTTALLLVMGLLLSACAAPAAAPAAPAAGDGGAALRPAQFDQRATQQLRLARARPADEIPRQHAVLRKRPAQLVRQPVVLLQDILAYFQNARLRHKCPLSS